MREVEIDWEGAKTTVQIKTSLTFGQVANIQSKAFIFDGKEPKINSQAYVDGLMIHGIEKAPWKLHSIDAINNLPYEVGKKVRDELLQEFPLRESVVDWIKVITGESLPEGELIPKSSGPESGNGG